MSEEFIVVLITVPSWQAGEAIARLLVESRLAACVNILPAVRSIYSWKGAIQSDEEVLLLAKSRAELFADQLLPAVKAAHPYELPEIIALPIRMGLPGYLDWINEATSPMA
jgi:periplasmic divalent cation tolerance protein